MVSNIKEIKQATFHFIVQLRKNKIATRKGDANFDPSIEFAFSLSIAGTSYFKSCICIDLHR